MKRCIMGYMKFPFLWAGDKQRTLWYVMVFLEWSIGFFHACLCHVKLNLRSGVFVVVVVVFFASLLLWLERGKK